MVVRIAINSRALYYSQYIRFLWPPRGILYSSPGPETYHLNLFQRIWKEIHRILLVVGAGGYKNETIKLLCPLQRDRGYR